MEKRAGKGQRGAGGVVQAPEDGGEVGIDAAQKPGVGDAGEVGDQAPGVADGARKDGDGLELSQATSLEELTATVLAESRQVVRMWHPDKKDALILAKNGSGIEVITGAPAYQLTTGETIEV